MHIGQIWLRHYPRGTYACVRGCVPNADFYSLYLKFKVITSVFISESRGYVYRSTLVFALNSCRALFGAMEDGSCRVTDTDRG